MAAVTEEPKIIELEDDAQIEEIENKENEDAGSDAGDSEGVPALEESKADEDQPQVQSSKQSRQEKKARKSIAKLGLKPVPGVTRVAIRKSKQMLFVINKPEVFKNPNSETYVVFGEAKIEDLSGQNSFQNKAAARMKEAEEKFAQEQASTKQPIADPIEEDDEEEDDTEIDADGLEDKDIDLVIQQANCNKNKAIKALKNNNGDIVNAIMELTM
jgi:nascent polypeptide-associated complex subunit alpha